MDTFTTPANIISFIARSLAQAVRALFLGWSAGIRLVLYYLDAILSAAVVTKAHEPPNVLPPIKSD
jgi:hypothetical protein